MAIKGRLDQNLKWGLSPDCDNPSKTVRSDRAIRITFGVGGGYFNPMTVIGNTTVYASYSCNVETTCKCCPGESNKRPVSFSGNCTVNFRLKDRFANPTDKMKKHFYERNEKAYQQCRKSCSDAFHWLWDGPAYNACMNRCKEFYPPSEWIGATPYDIVASWTEQYSWSRDIGDCPGGQ